MNSPVVQFWLPDQITTLVATIAELYSPKTAIDPCCDDIRLLDQCAFAKEREAIFRNPSSLRAASAQAQEIALSCGDITKKSLDKLFDLVVTCLPFGNRVVTNVPTHRVDYLVAERSLDIVAPNGVCLIIAPFNFLTAPLFQPFRDRVLNEYALDAVIEFPRSAFGRTMVIPFALLVIRYGPQHQSGTFLGEYDEEHSERLIASLRERVGKFFVRRDVLRNRWDRNFHDPRHQEVEAELDASESRRLEELGEIERGHPRLREYLLEQGEFLVLSPAHLRHNEVIQSERDRFVNRLDTPWFEKCVLQPGDVVVSLMRPTVYVYRETDPPSVLGWNLARIRSNENDYIATYLNTPDGQALFDAQAQRHVRGASFGALSVSDLRNIRIPILPIANLNSVGDNTIQLSSPSELEVLRQELLRVKHQLEVTEAKLQEQRTPTDTILKTLKFLATQNDKILEQQQAMNAKIDLVVRSLASMREDIGDIKQSSRSDEEKLIRICANLDNFTDTATAATRSFQEYVNVVRSWLDRWDVLETLTQKFLPSAEQLYDLLEKQAGADFSPFIIQYCRAIENEILAKLFSAYHDDIRKREPHVAGFVANDLQIEKTKRFAKNVSDDNRRYTLGDMSFVLQLLKLGGRTLASSVLLQDFRKFATTYFDQRVAEKEFLDLIQQINEEFRCKAAHPYLMTKELADKCLETVRTALSELLDSYQTGRTQT